MARRVATAAPRPADWRASCRVGYPCAVARAPGTPFLTNTFRGAPVAAVCDLCGKGPGFGNNRPWSRKRTRRRFNPNIQRVRAVVGKTPKRLNVCTSCLKAGKVVRPA